MQIVPGSRSTAQLSHERLDGLLSVRWPVAGPVYKTTSVFDLACYCMVASANTPEPLLHCDAQSGVLPSRQYFHAEEDADQGSIVKLSRTADQGRGRTIPGETLKVEI